MELVVCSSNSNEHIKQKEHVRVDCCSLHPSTLLDLRVPVLGVVLVQIKDENFSVGVKTFVRSLPCDRVPPGEIRLAPWVLDLLPTPPTKVRVESISANQPLHLVKKLIVAPLEDSTGLYSITNWVRPTHATNSQIIQNRKTTRNWIEKSIKQRIEGQLVGLGFSFRCYFIALRL
ncbi:hypothetical protein BX616_008144 [Lobosporangium transversale]|uniref:Uncharacterized protein n=1 Tax=Lobosporangium transversale TaxID=64571 RepID=A0A1Y2GVY1_9FUNG|nr:hypothetical protein BCR41DRAFT_223616 [Lobosporangium transversale]KAF9914513.1 hypothetical protein BX616_008144 [Lobosporangium transversale]ORZ26460.1 hypothetical protein BCR41DRAFT_223616 [Lobosporangium transversale]|eukprot:XP_021884225.1 hypothetical protein BCR41DRAFT_223616 [Lobosporangium transversale]